MPPHELIYWDSCIFISWLKNEQRPNNELDGVIECIERVEKNEIRLITSVVTKTEVFEADLTNEIRDLYSKLLNRRNVQLVDNDFRTAELAREIREYYQYNSNISINSKITSPDAIHLATAIHYKADAFYTFDNGKHGGISLISLDGNVAGYNIKICKPPVKQLRLHY